MFREVNGVLLHTASFGPGPRTIVAYGGWTGSWELWLEPFEILSRTLRCIGIDHRGAGESTAPPDVITVEGMVEDLMAVLDSEGVGRCLLAGESRGAIVCLVAAAQHPERFEGLVLVAPAVGGAPEDAAQFAAALRTDYDATLAAFVRACVPNSDPHVLKWGRDVLARAEPEAAIRLAEAYEEATVVPSAVSAPVLIVHGESDVIVPLSSAQHLAAALPDARLVTLPGAGHVPTMTHASQVVAAIEERFGTSSGR